MRFLQTLALVAMVSMVQAAPVINVNVVLKGKTYTTDTSTYRTSIPIQQVLTIWCLKMAAMTAHVNRSAIIAAKRTLPSVEEGIMATIDGGILSNLRNSARRIRCALL